jgi:hypothetical protein
MILKLDQSGPHRPVTGTPGRRPGSVRRTSTIDTSRPGGLFATAIVRGSARDLMTGVDGGARVVASAGLEAAVEPSTKSLESLVVQPAHRELAALVGSSVAAGFRARLDAAAPELAESGGPLYLLLDDLPGAVLVGGYAFLRADAIPVAARGAHLTVDICAGWAEGSTMVTAIRDLGQTPTPMGPAAPRLVDPEDPEGWHPMGDPGPHGTRRLRRVDVGGPGADGCCPVDVLFRDSHWDDSGVETVVHEYSLSVTVDPEAETIVTIDAVADVLPWVECPQALGSASRLAGRSFADLRQWVRSELRGTSTCTHLNDTLRSLSDLGVLLAEVC